MRKTFTLDHAGFVDFIEDVLCQCLRGDALCADDASTTASGSSQDDSQVLSCLEPGNTITVHTHKIDGVQAMFTVDDLETVEALQGHIETNHGVPAGQQRLLLGDSVLDLSGTFREQGVANDSVISVLCCKPPQATLLRIRRVNLGNTSESRPRPGRRESATQNGIHKPDRAVAVGAAFACRPKQCDLGVHGDDEWRGDNVFMPDRPADAACLAMEERGTGTDELATEMLPSLLPASPALRSELLQNDASLREVCMAYHARHAGSNRNAISVRVAGRVVADIHRELGLAVPTEETLYRSMMPYTNSSEFTLAHPDFVGFLEDVLRDCISGTALRCADHDAAAPTRPLTSLSHDSCNKPGSAITVSVNRLDGQSTILKVDDSETAEVLHAQVEQALGIATCRQRLLLDTSPLEASRTLRDQGVSDGAVITVVSSKPPQAMLLRIRRVNIGNTSEAPKPRKTDQS